MSFSTSRGQLHAGREMVINLSFVSLDSSCLCYLLVTLFKSGNTDLPIGIISPKVHFVHVIPQKVLRVENCFNILQKSQGLENNTKYRENEENYRITLSPSTGKVFYQNGTEKLATKYNISREEGIYSFGNIGIKKCSTLSLNYKQVIVYLSAKKLKFDQIKKFIFHWMRATKILLENRSFPTVTLVNTNSMKYTKAHSLLQT